MTVICPKCGIEVPNPVKCPGCNKPMQCNLSDGDGEHFTQEYECDCGYQIVRHWTVYKPKEHKNGGSK